MTEFYKSETSSNIVVKFGDDPPMSIFGIKLSWRISDALIN